MLDESDYKRGRSIGRGAVFGFLGGITLTGVLAGGIALTKLTGSPEVDLGPYLRLSCDGAPVTRDAASLGLDLKEGYEIRVGDYKLKSLGNGRLLFTGVSRDNSNKSSKPIEVAGPITFESNGVSYEIKPSPGLGKGTEVEISRGCERG